MKQLIEQFGSIIAKNEYAEDSSTQVECNYSDNYYGDQVCQQKSTD